jgi:hypothetical protein
VWNTFGVAVLFVIVAAGITLDRHLNCSSVVGSFGTSPSRGRRATV